MEASPVIGKLKRLQRNDDPEISGLSYRRGQRHLIPVLAGSDDPLTGGRNSKLQAIRRGA